MVTNGQNPDEFEPEPDVLRYVRDFKERARQERADLAETVFRLLFAVKIALQAIDEEWPGLELQDRFELSLDIAVRMAARDLSTPQSDELYGLHQRFQNILEGREPGAS